MTVRELKDVVAYNDIYKNYPNQITYLDHLIIKKNEKIKSSDR